MAEVEPGTTPCKICWTKGKRSAWPPTAAGAAIRIRRVAIGYGYVEVGHDNPGHQYIAAGEVRFTYQKGKMWQNFDVIAHEMGHVILFKRIGFPQSAGEVTDWFQIQDAEFLAFHELMADLCAILSLLDIKQARERILATKGGINVLAGVGELQNLAEPGFLPIRSALNKEKYPGPGQLQNNLEFHKHSLPLTGAVFDSLLRVYERLEDFIRKSRPS